MEKEQFITVKPEKAVLREYISYYYFHSPGKSDETKRFLYYPNFKNALTIYRDSEVEFQPGFSRVTPFKGRNCVLYSGVQRQFRKAEIVSPFEKVGVVFQELGINHMIDEPLMNLNHDSVDMSFEYFGNELFDVFQAKGINEKTEFLDEFFLNRIQSFDEDVLKSAVAMIIESEEKQTVQSLSETFNVSRKTLLRLFQKHLCCSVKEYIDIVHFRKALNSYVSNSETSFTETALENHYYDQSQFINHFKKLTGINPKTFFQSIEQLGNEDTFWNFD